MLLILDNIYDSFFFLKLPKCTLYADSSTPNPMHTEFFSCQTCNTIWLNSNKLSNLTYLQHNLIK